MMQINRGFRSPLTEKYFLIFLILLVFGVARAENLGEQNPLLITIVGFNYTDRHIDSFSVNGAGGGNVFLSSADSGGGGATCCVTLSRNGAKFSQVRIKWQFDGCTYLARSRVSGEVVKNVYSYFRQANVAVDLRAVERPNNLEVHFYQDGSVVAELTENLSRPRVILDGQREDKSRFPRCPNDKKPD